MNSFDIIIIGAGAVGSAAAYYLAQANKKVLVLEQFEFNHKKGSSYGYSRVIRYAYNNPVYINLMREAYPLWFALEEAAGETLYLKTGQLDFGILDYPELLELADIMEQENLPYERLTAAEINQRFPQFNIPENMGGLYQPDTGLLKASSCVLNQLKLAQKYGALIEDNIPVNQLIIDSNGVTVKTSKDIYHSSQVIIAAGSWTKQLLTSIGLDLPLTIMPCQLAFFKPENTEDFKPGKFPIFLAYLTGEYGQFPYGLPIADHQGVKLSTFYGWNTVKTIEEVDYIPSQEWVEKIRQFVCKYLPTVNGELIESRRCLYTMTPDKHFIVDYHPEYSNVLIAAGLSGHGFKFSNLIGKILTDLIIDKETRYDLSLFKMSRFLSPK